MKIHPAIVLAAVVFLGILIWFLTTAEFSNAVFSATDYTQPITDEAGVSLSGSNLIVMDTAGNMKLAPIDTFNTNTQSNFNKIVSSKVPGQITTAINEVRGKAGQTAYAGSLRDIVNGLDNRYTKSEINNSLNNRYTKEEANSKFIEFNDNVYIHMGPGHSGSSDVYGTNKYLSAKGFNYGVRYDGGRGGKWRLEKAPNETNKF